MTRLFNDPADLTDEVIDGFVAAHPPESEHLMETPRDILEVGS